MSSAGWPVRSLPLVPSSASHEETNMRADYLYACPLASLTAHVNRVIPADEPLTPGIAWVGVSTLAGSLVARNRACTVSRSLWGFDVPFRDAPRCERSFLQLTSKLLVLPFLRLLSTTTMPSSGTFLLRMIAPPAFFLISLPYFLPKLASNLSREVSATTAVRAPEFHAQAAQLRHTLDDTFEHAEDWLADTRKSVAGTVGSTVSFVERKTGLQLYQAFESSFSRRPEVGHHGHEQPSSTEPAHDRVVISAKPVDHATVPLFTQTQTTASVLPGTPIPAPGTTIDARPVQTLDVPIYRRVSGPPSTTERLDAAASTGLDTIEAKLASGVQAAKASDVGQAAGHAADEAKEAVGAGLSGLKRKAEEALQGADHNAARAVGKTAEAIERGERKLGETVEAGKRKAGEAVDVAKREANSAAEQAKAEASRVVRGLDTSDSRELSQAAASKASRVASEAKAEASRVVRGLDNGADARTLGQAASTTASQAAHEAKTEATRVARGLDDGSRSLSEVASTKTSRAADEARAEASRVARGFNDSTSGVDGRSLGQTAADKAKALAHSAEDAANDAARFVRTKAAGLADQADSAASNARTEADRLKAEGSRAARRAEDATADARSSVQREASHLSHEASSLASAAQSKASSLAHAVEERATSAARTVEGKASELSHDTRALVDSGETKARSALASTESKVNRAAEAVESKFAQAKAEAKDGLERVEQSATELKRKADEADKRLKVDEQTVDGKRQEQPAVVGLLAGRERESGYKKLV